MSDDIFRQEVVIPAIVEDKVNQALSMINGQSENEKKKDKVSKKKDSKIVTFVKRTVAVVAGVAVLLTTVSAADYFVRKNSDSKLMPFSFSIMVNASELDEANAAFLGGEDGVMHGGIGIGPDQLEYLYELPINIAGNDIDRVNYSIEGAAFQVHSLPDKPFVIEGTEASDDYSFFMNDEGEFESHTGCYRKDVDCRYYSNFSVAFDNQLPEGSEINFVNIIKDDSKLINAFRDASFLTEEEKCVFYNYLFKDITITCTVTYKNGSTESKALKIQADMYADNWTSEEGIQIKGEKMGFYLAIAGSEADINKEKNWEELISDSTNKTIDDSKYEIQELQRDRKYEIEGVKYGFGFSSERAETEEEKDKSYLWFDDEKLLISEDSFAWSAYYVKGQDGNKSLVIDLEKEDFNYETRIYAITESGLEQTDSISGQLMGYSFIDQSIIIGSFDKETGGAAESRYYQIVDGKFLDMGEY